MGGHGYLFDENVPLVISTQLKHREPAIDLYTIGHDAAPPRGTPDPDILKWIETNDCLLITNNRASMPVHLQEHLAQGLSVPGIIQLPLTAITPLSWDKLHAVRLLKLWVSSHHYMWDEIAAGWEIRLAEASF